MREADVFKRQVGLGVVGHWADIVVVSVCPSAPWEIIEMTVGACEYESDRHRGWLGSYCAVAMDIAGFVGPVGAGVFELEGA